MESDKSVIKTINGLLNSSKTRIQGLISLNAHLNECSDENFVECCPNWMQNCCKTIDGASQEINLSVQILSALFKISSSYPELNKPVSFFITNRFFDHFFKYFIHSVHGWECAKACFLHYRGPCGPSLDNIEKHLLSRIKKKEKISQDISDCMALFPSLGGGGNEGVNHKANWKNQFVKYIHITHSILNDLFADVEELQDYDTKNHTYLRVEKHPSTEYLAILLNNHCSILSSMLLNSFPVSKSVSTEALMELVCRGLSFNPTSLGKSETTSLIALRRVLPEIQSTMLDLLNAFIAACGSQLLSNSHLICKLIKQTLDWTQSQCTYGSSKKFANLRISVYNIVCSWLVATKTGGCLESIAHHFVLHALSDIEFKTAVTLLKEAKSKSKKRRSDATEQSNRRVDPQANACLCFAALRGLQSFLRYLGVFIQPEDHKILQETVVKLVVDVYKNGVNGDTRAPFGVSKCRKELFSLLLELVNHPNPACPPPTHFALRLFKTGENDMCPEVAQFCSAALNAVTVIIHEQFSNGPVLTAPETVQPLKEVAVNLTWINDERNEVENLETETSSRDEDVMEIDGETEQEKENQVLEGGDDLEEEESVMKKAEQEKSIEDSFTALNPSPPTVLTPEKSSDKQSPNPVVVTPEKCEETTVESPNKSREEVPSDKNKTEFEDSPPKMQFSLEGEPKEGSPQKSKSPRKSEILLDEPISKRNRVSDGDSTDNLNKSNLIEDVTVENRKGSDAEGSIPDVDDVVAENDEISKAFDSEREKKTTSENSSPLEKRNSDESPGEKSTTPDLTESVKYFDYKKRYFLRSKTGNGTSDDSSEETLKRTESVDSLRQTPTRNLGRNTPTSALRRPRTRALSKLEPCDTNETGTPKKTDDDIIEDFNSAIKD